MRTDRNELLRCLPSVSAVLEQEEAKNWLGGRPHSLVSASIRAALADLRKAILCAERVEPVELHEVLARAEAELSRRSAPLLRKVINATGIVLGTPIYMFRIAGQMKFFVDRMYSYYQYKQEGRGYDSAVPPGKNYALVISQGAPDSDQYKRSARWLAGMAGTGLGLSEVGRIIHSNSHSAPAIDDEKLLEEAKVIGRRLVTNGSNEHQ